MGKARATQAARARADALFSATCPSGCLTITSENARGGPSWPFGQAPRMQMAKDLDLILGAGHAVGVPLQLAAQVSEIYGSLIARGDGESDFIATVRHLERLSGLGEPTL
jgi:hypothetical protein